MLKRRISSHTSILLLTSLQKDRIRLSLTKEINIFVLHMAQSTHARTLITNPTSFFIHLLLSFDLLHWRHARRDQLVNVASSKVVL